MNEDDTFRILSRKPIDEVCEIIFQKAVLGLIHSEQEFQDLVESYGYTYKEYLDYNNFI